MVKVKLFFDLHGVLANSRIIYHEYKKITVRHLMKDFHLSFHDAQARYDRALKSWEDKAFSYLRSQGTPKVGMALKKKIDEFDHFFVQALYDGLIINGQKKRIRTRPYEYKIARKIVAIYPEVKKVLQDLEDRGFVMHVASSSHSSHVRGILEGGGIEEFFSRVMGIDTLNATKHTTEYYQNMIRLTHANPKYSFLIGNSIAEIIYPPKIHLKTIHVNRERKVPPDIKKLAYKTIDNLTQLPSIVCKMEQASI